MSDRDRTAGSATTTVLGALRAADTRGALEGLLAVWQRTRASMVAELIDQLISRLPLRVAAEGETWDSIARQRDPRDLNYLLQHWTDNVSSDVIAARLITLMDLGDDPRLARELATTLFVHSHGRGVGKNQGVLTDLEQRAFDYLRTLPDVRTTRILRKIALTVPGALGTNAAALADHLETNVRPLDVEQEWAYEVIRALPPPQQRDDDPPPIEPLARRAWDLLHAVYNDPTDDGLRLVCADAFSEMNDPRGEFIVLGFKVAEGKAKATERARLKSLTRKHGRMWMGRAGRLELADVTFIKGFLGAIDINTNARLRFWREVATAPELSTVERIDIRAGDTRDWFEAVASAPSLTHLRELVLDPVHHSAIEYALDRHTAPYFRERLEAFGCSSKVIRVEDIKAIRNRFPKIQKLALSWLDTRWNIGGGSSSSGMIAITEERGIRELAAEMDGIQEIIIGSDARLAGLATNIITHLNVLPTSITRVQIAAGPEQWSLVRSPLADANLGVPNVPSKWSAKVIAAGDDYEAARVRAVLAAVPQWSEILEGEIAIPEGKTA